jgi:hypothetical protein
LKPFGIKKVISLEKKLILPHLALCAEFSHYFQENYAEFSDTQLKKLFDKIEKISAQENTDEVATALYTCFLENIAQTESGSFAKQFMGKRSEEFFNNWN